MSIDLEKKVPLLRGFHEKLYVEGWKFMESKIYVVECGDS